MQQPAMQYVVHVRCRNGAYRTVQASKNVIVSEVEKAFQRREIARAYEVTIGDNRNRRLIAESNTVHGQWTWFAETD